MTKGKVKPLHDTVRLVGAVVFCLCIALACVYSGYAAWAVVGALVGARGPWDDLAGVIGALTAAAFSPRVALPVLGGLDDWAERSAR